MIKRRKTRQLQIGDVKIGSNAKISVQSMCNTNTCDVVSTLSQINELKDAGCEIVRLAVLNKDAALAIKEIKKKSPIPIVADIHFDYRLALECINNGIDALRINPGNIGSEENVKKVVKLAKTNKIPIRIGINYASLDKRIASEDISASEKMVKSALENVKIFENTDFDLIKISLKSSSVQDTIEAYKLLSDKVDYPFHLGLTESGTLKRGLVKSSVALGCLLNMGIGDTIRVSLSENPVEEVFAGFEIIKSLNLRQKGVNFISCPTCGRCKIDLISLAHKVEEKFKNVQHPITIATMGCAVNGPGEAKHADFGIAGGINEGYIFVKGEIVARVEEEKLLEKFEQIVLECLKQKSWFYFFYKVK